MKPDIIALRTTRGMCLGAALAFWILTGYGLYLGLEAVWIGVLAGVAVISTWLVIEVTRVLRIANDREWRKL